MNVMLKPTIGTRFLMHGREFEIQVVAGKHVRYASVKGGTSHTFELEKFQKYVEDNHVSITQNAQDLLLRPDNCADILRRRAYVERAVNTLTYLSKRDDLRKIIDGVKTELKDKKPPSTSSLIRWIKAYEKDETKGLAVVRSGNVSPRFSMLIYNLFWDALREVYLKPEHRQAEDVLDYIIGQLGSRGLSDEHNCMIAVPSLRSVQRWIKDLDPIMVIYAKKGKEAAKRAARASGCKFISPGVLNVVQIDTHYMNIGVVDPDTGEYLGRPYLVILICVRTRKIVGIYISLYPPGACTTLAAFKDMLVNYGKPGILMNDRGSEFINYALESLCDDLNVVIQTGPPRTPNARSHIESFFATLVEALINKMPGTTFSNPAQRGAYNTKKNSIFTLAQIESYTREWIDEIYHKREHSQTCLTPNFMWERETQLIPPYKMTRAEVDAIARTPRWRTVHGGRILLNKIFYYSHALMMFNKRKVKILFDELNLHNLIIVDPDDPKNLITADSTDPEYTKGLTLDQHNEARKELKKLSNQERQRLGIYATAFSRYRLLARIHEDQDIGQRWLAKIKNGGLTNDLLPGARAQSQPAREIDTPDIEGEYSVVTPANEPNIPELSDAPDFESPEAALTSHEDTNDSQPSTTTPAQGKSGYHATFTLRR